MITYLAFKPRANQLRLQGDVATKEGCTKIADAVKANEGTLDVLVNCAGVGVGYRKEAHPDDRKSILHSICADFQPMR